MPDDARLHAALAVIQSRGAIGERSLDAAIAHADRFVALIPAGPLSLVDLGSGGGLPALVIAWRRRDLVVTMVERRVRRADLLRRAVAALELEEHTEVRACDVRQLCAEQRGSYAVVTARSFADPATTAGFIDCLLSPTGRALVSEPPAGRPEIWAGALSAYPDLRDLGLEQGIRVLGRPSVA